MGSQPKSFLLSQIHSLPFSFDTIVKRTLSFSGRFGGGAGGPRGGWGEGERAASVFLLEGVFLVCLLSGPLPLDESLHVPPVQPDRFFLSSWLHLAAEFGISVSA